MEKRKQETRYRTWWAIGYPESLKENFISVLEEALVPCLVSPLHDKDKHPNGEAKKPHYHIVLLFSSVKSLSQVKEVFDSIGAVMIQPVSDTAEAARYLCHINCHEKYRYDEKDVTEIGSVNYLELITTTSDRNKVIDEMCDYVDVNKVTSFAALAKYARQNMPNWRNSLYSNSTVFMKEYIRSRSWEWEQEEQSKFNSLEEDKLSHGYTLTEDGELKEPVVKLDQVDTSDLGF